MKDEDLIALVRAFIFLFIYFACLLVARMEMFLHKMEQERALSWKPNKAFLQIIRQSGYANLIGIHVSCFVGWPRYGA